MKNTKQELISPSWIIPVVPEGITLKDHSLLMEGSAIADILPTEQARQTYAGVREIVLEKHVLLPGLINLHTHAAMSLLRGIGDDLPLMRWLQEKIWPVENTMVCDAFVEEGTLLACAEMLRGGITCFNDMYFHPAAAARAAQTAGMRAALGIVVIDFPTRYASDAADYLAKGLAARDDYQDDPLLSFTLAPHAPYTVSDETFRRVLTYANQLDLPIHVHIHETADEIAQSQEKYGVRPLERLRRLNLLGPSFIGVHAVHINDSEADLLALHGCHLAHCPTSNLKLASGIAPLPVFHERQISTGLGTDGCASNNRLDLFQEMRMAALLGKAVSNRADFLNAHEILRMATLSGARALGLESRLGSIETGKQADLCAVDLSNLEHQPVYDPASHLIYVAGRDQVSHTWVAGELRYCNGQAFPYTERLENAVRLWQNKTRM